MYVCVRVYGVEERKGTAITELASINYRFWKLAN